MLCLSEIQSPNALRTSIFRQVCGALLALGVVGPASSLSLQHIFARLSETDRRPVRAAFSSNSRTSPIVGSGFAYKCTAALILVILYSASNDFIPCSSFYISG